MGNRSTAKSTPDGSVRLMTDVNNFVNEDHPLPVTVIGGSGGGGGGTIDGNVGVLDSTEARINPATEETLDDVKTALTGLQTFVDGLETLLAGTNSALAGLAASLTSIGTYTDQLEGFTDGLEGSLTTLAGKDFATEAKLEAVRVLLASLDSKDYATETTLATLESKDFATETKLEAVRALLASLDGKDFATQATLVQVKTILDSLALTDFATEASILDLLDETENMAWDVGLLTALTTAIRDGDRTLSKRFEWVSVGGEFKPLYIGKALPGSAESDAVWWVTRWTFADQGGGDYKPVSVDSKIGIAWDDRVTELP